MSKKYILFGGIFLIIAGLLSFLFLYEPAAKEEENGGEKKEHIAEVEDYGGAHLKSDGQNVHQKGFGTFTLLEKKTVGRTFTLGPMVMNIQEIKLIELSDMADEAKELLSAYTGMSFEEAAKKYYKDNLSLEEIDEKAAFSKLEIGDTLTYFEVSYSVQNTSDKELQFFSFEDITFNNQFSYQVPAKNFLLSDDTFIGTKGASKVDYQPKETRNGLIGLINDSNQTVSALTSFTFTTDHIADGETHELLMRAKTFELDLTKK